MAVTSFHCFRSFFHVIFLTSHQNRDIYKISNQNVISKITQPHEHVCISYDLTNKKKIDAIDD